MGLVARPQLFQYPDNNKINYISFIKWQAMAKKYIFVGRSVYKIVLDIKLYKVSFIIFVEKKLVVNHLDIYKVGGD